MVVRNPAAAAVSIVVVLTFLLSVPLVSVTEVEAGPGEEVMWDDHYEFHGNCSSRPTKSFFYVNATALNLSLVVKFHTTGPMPGADLVLYGPDSYVVETEHIADKLYFFEMKALEPEKRGRWSLSLTMVACGVDEAVDFTIWLNISNRLLGRPVTDRTEVVAGESVMISMEEAQLAEGESFMVEVGDGSSSGWVTKGTESRKVKTTEIELSCGRSAPERPLAGSQNSNGAE